MGAVIHGMLSEWSRKGPIGTTTYTEPGSEPNGQGYIEAVPLTDNSSNEYQGSYQGDETKPDTEGDIEALDTAVSTLLGQRRESHAALRQENNHPRTELILTASRL